MPVSDSDDIGKRLQQFCLDELNARFSNVEANMNLALATVLDPRFKAVYFNNPRCKANVISEISKVSKSLMAAQGEARAALAREAEAAPVIARPGSLWRSHNAFVANASCNFRPDCPGGMPVEFRKYLDDPVYPLEANPFEVWQTLKYEFPILYKQALKALPTVATSVSAERLFSGAGFIAGPYSSRLTPSHLNMLTFLRTISEELWVKCRQ